MTEENSYDDLANYLDKAISQNSSIVSNSIKNVAKSVSNGTHEVSNAVALVNENEWPIKMPVVQTPIAIPNANTILPANTMPVQIPTSYVPQAKQEDFKPILDQLERLRA